MDDETEPARLYGDKPYPQSMAMQGNLMGEGQGSSLPNTFNMDLFRTSEMRDSFASSQVERSGLAAVHTDRHVKQALLYCYRKRTEEIKAFHKAKEIKKMGYEVEGVLLSRDGMIQSWSSRRQQSWIWILEPWGSGHLSQCSIDTVL